MTNGLYRPRTSGRRYTRRCGAASVVDDYLPFTQPRLRPAAQWRHTSGISGSIPIFHCQRPAPRYDTVHCIKPHLSCTKASTSQTRRVHILWSELLDIRDTQLPHGDLELLSQHCTSVSASPGTRQPYHKLLIRALTSDSLGTTVRPACSSSVNEGSAHTDSICA
jgi:hypothetical protein